MKELVCINCDASRSVGRKLCSKCNSDRVRQYGRYTWKNKCVVCTSEFAAWRKHQEMCSGCYSGMKALEAETISSNNYRFCKDKETGQYVVEQRLVAETLLEEKLDSSIIVHHVDEDEQNNHPSNLMLTNRSVHGSLHRFLSKEKFILSKKDEDVENTWKKVAEEKTRKWLTDNGKEAYFLMDLVTDLDRYNFEEANGLL